METEINSKKCQSTVNVNFVQNNTTAITERQRHMQPLVYYFIRLSECSRQYVRGLQAMHKG